MINVTFRDTKYIFVAIIASLFALTFALTALSGVGALTALIWSIFGLLAISYPGNLIP
jgi:hypothetical protein